MTQGKLNLILFFFQWMPKKVKAIAKTLAVNRWLNQMLVVMVILFLYSSALFPMVSFILFLYSSALFPMVSFILFLYSSALFPMVSFILFLYSSALFPMVSYFIPIF